jgi:TetR/AcrR family transcriptional regulator, transcriptional repressor for nem operon
MMTGRLHNFVKRFSRRFQLSGGNGTPPEGANLARMIVSAYLSRAHLDDVEGSCPLIGLPTDVGAAGLQ